MAPAANPNTPEGRAREKIDALLEQSGGTVQDRADMNLSVPAVAVREFKLERGHGYADYLLFVDGVAIGVCEAKKAGVATWSEKKQPDGRWRAYTYAELVARDKCSLDLFWLKDESLEDSAKLPDPHVLAEEIADGLSNALEQIESVLGDLRARAAIIAKRA